MPILKSDDYLPARPFRNGHLNTIFPAVFRKRHKLPWERHRLATPDDDFIDIDILPNGKGRLAILYHGLEGSSASQYILGMADLLSQNGWDVAAVNHRGCSGEINRQVRMYHSGATDDVHLTIGFLQKKYDGIALIGFSLGGNMVLKYAGENGGALSEKIKAVVAVSVPVDLSACSHKLRQPSNWVYDHRFLQRLREKVHLKNRQYPEAYPLGLLEKVKTLWDFDEHFTSRVHGFDGAEDYYAQCNSLQFLHKIKVPTLILNAQDDPFLAPSCFPKKIAEESGYVHLLASRYGGHCGFTSFGKRNYWSEHRVLGFCGRQINWAATYRPRQ